MQPVEIMPIQDSLVLRARGSELLILAQHVTELKQRKSPRDFSMYFTSEALVNRPARKLFEAWLRKDGSLWHRLFKMVHEMEQGGGDVVESKPEVKAKQVAAKSSSPVVEPAAKAGKAEKATKAGKPAKADVKKETAAKAEPKKAAAKPTKAAKPAAAKSTSTKSAAKAPAKSPAKAKTAAKPAGKSASKSTGKSASKR